MSAKPVLFRSSAREKMLRGATSHADAVRITLGAKSKSVLIRSKWGAPIVCNDGVTIAKEMRLGDPEENLGAQRLRQAGEKTGDIAGDGTSTSTLLAQAIYAEGVRNGAAGRRQPGLQGRTGTQRLLPREWGMSRRTRLHGALKGRLP
jgi:chaperonin GroEL